ncbi:MAG: hypothetical protein HY811_00940 [Planctomycetes bacterium]|nr:hypothetical protein [Planctomycetota bacterium]
MKNKNILFIYMILVLTVVLTAVLYEQRRLFAEEADIADFKKDEEDKKKAFLKTETQLVEEQGAESIFVRGETNLPANTLLQVELKGGISLLNQPDNVQLIDMLKVSVNNDGQYFVRFAGFKLSFNAEYYEVKIRLFPDQPKDVLIAENFSEDSLNQLGDYHLINVLSTNIPNIRQKSVIAFIGLINEHKELYQQLMDKVYDIEKMKQGDSAIEENLKKVFGIKNKEEIFDALSNDWLAWEKEWLAKINKMIASLKEEGVCFGTASNIYQTTNQILDYYRGYRRAAFDAKNVLKGIPLPAYLVEPFKLSDERKIQQIDLLESEVLLRISRDLIARIYETGSVYGKCLKDKEKGNETWADFKFALVKYLNGLILEMKTYADLSLFLEIPPDKDPKKESYKQLAYTIEFSLMLIDKLDSKLINPDNQKIEADINELINFINQKTKDFLLK